MSELKETKGMYYLSAASYLIIFFFLFLNALGMIPLYYSQVLISIIALSAFQLGLTFAAIKITYLKLKEKIAGNGGESNG